MSAADLIGVVINLVFGVAFVGVVRAAVHERSRASLDTLLLLFGAFGLLTLENEFFLLLRTAAPPPIALASGVVLLAIPYLLLRLARDFADVPIWLHRGGLGLFVLLVVGLPFLSSPQVPIYLALQGLYFVGGGLFAGIAFARRAHDSMAIVRRRMIAASVGSFTLGLLMAVAVIHPLPRATTATATLLLELICAIAYLVAFAPPAVLRRAWREPYLRSFVAHATAISPVSSEREIVQELAHAIRVATAASDVRMFMWDGAADGLRDGADRLAAGGELVDRTFATQRPLVGAGIAVPITRGDLRLGVLFIGGRRLFVSEWLEMAQLLADQSAIVLTGARLYADLATANRQLSEATRVKSEFLANMSHELRTPLNAILGFSGLLFEQLTTSLTDRQQRFLRNISEAGEHLLDLINDVLDLSKVEAGRIELRREVIALSALTEPVVAAFSTAAHDKGLRADVSMPADVRLLVDSTRLRQILFNLVSNAVKFTTHGVVQLRAAVDGADLEFAVIDSGVGIPERDHSRVFGVFERFHEGRVEAPGTGLGLALTKRLVELMGGSIRFDSREGNGTTFWVQLPGVVAQPISGPRVLVLEDERHDAELVAAVAASLDLPTEVVGTLASAQAALRRSPPLGVVLDLQLPDGRGEILLRELKEPSAGHIPVVVVSVEADPGTVVGLGADDYIPKPIDRARLLRWLRRLKDSADPTVLPAK